VSQAQPLTAPPDDIIVNVFPDGHLVVNQETVSPAKLENLLAGAHQRYANQSVLIRGDGKGTYQSIMDVLSICQRAGIHNYSLATQVKPE
jgi:biopolymer transport protein ExbD